MKNKMITQHKFLCEKLLYWRKTKIANNKRKIHYVKNYYNHFNIFFTPKKPIHLLSQ